MVQSWLCMYKAWGRVHVVDIIMDKRTTDTMQDDSLTHVLQCPVQCPFFYNHHAILCTNTTLHIRYTPALAGISWASWCVHFPPLSVCCWRFLCLIETWVNFCWGRRRESQGWQKHFSFGQAKYSAGIMHLCRGYEAADYLCKALKTFDVILVCWVQSTHL